MAIRLKKLARELKTSPSVVLSALADLGYDRYKSEMDMVADPPADKVRKLARKKGLKKPSELGVPASVPTPAPPPRPKSARPAPKRSRSTDVMASLVPGVVPTRRAEDPLDVPIEALAAGTPAAQAPPAAHTDAAAFREEERRQQARSQALAEREQELAEDKARLAQERQAILDEKRRVEAEIEVLREQLDARAAALDAVQAGGVPLATLLEGRGLRGSDEQGRALDALARSRLLDPLLPKLRVVDPGPFVRLLADRLVLVGGESEDIPGVAVVGVPPDRAEVPGRAELDQLRSHLAGEFLLSGLTRVRLVGGGPVLLRLLKGGLDSRVSLDLVPARQREGADVAEDLADVDALVLWNVTESEEARAAYDASPVTVVRVGGDGGLPGLLHGVREALLPD